MVRVRTTTYAATLTLELQGAEHTHRPQGFSSYTLNGITWLVSNQPPGQPVNRSRRPLKGGPAPPLCLVQDNACNPHAIKVIIACGGVRGTRYKMYTWSIWDRLSPRSSWCGWVVKGGQKNRSFLDCMVTFKLNNYYYCDKITVEEMPFCSH